MPTRSPSPSQSPSEAPSTSPSRSPRPSWSPSEAPSTSPSRSPSPSQSPSKEPSTSPSQSPSMAPSAPVCPEVDIVFGNSCQVTANNIGGREGSNDKFAMVTNVGTYNGQPFHLKLESALPNGDDPNCSPGSAANQASC
ncbi:hypothetical protein THAOC_24660, partial [Thalassiosira oceanica]